MIKLTLEASHHITLEITRHTNLCNLVVLLETETSEESASFTPFPLLYLPDRLFGGEKKGGRERKERNKEEGD